MPDMFAYLVLYASPLAVVLLFRLLPRTQALCWSIVASYLFLPLGIGKNFPLLPPLSKELLPVVAAGLMCLAVRPDPPGREMPGPARMATGGRAPARAPGDRAPADAHAATDRGGAGVRTRKVWIASLLLLLLVSTPFLTMMQNGDPIAAGTRFIAGLQPYDAASMILNALVTVAPLLIARRYLASSEQHATLLRVLCAAGVAYTLLALVEIRMSPQLNRWIYGYAPGMFAQSMRDGGYRPMAFVGHGLRLALFLAMAVLAGVAAWRHGRRLGEGSRWLLAAFWTLGVLALCHSLGALVSAVLLLPVALLLSVRTQMIVAAVVAVTVLVYPMLRGAGLIPVDRVYDIAASISEDRAASFKYRLDNEDILLDKANQRSLAGWGSWGRNRVYDPNTGRDLSVTDGAWIIVIGISGWLGYVAQFGLLTIPTILLAGRRRGAGLSFATSGLCLVLTANLIDLIPNSGLTSVTWLIAGAVLGRLEAGARDVVDARTGVAAREGAGGAEPAHADAPAGGGAWPRPAYPLRVRARSGAAVPRSAGR